MDAVSTDPHLWLEDITGEDALNWVRAHNEPTLKEFCGDEFEQMRSEALEVLDTDARIPYVRRRGEYLYNFWRDAANPRGLWRRTTLESYRSDSPEWDVLIDVDALAAADDENWVWAGANVIEPDYTRALISLSRGGADAAIVREFDMETRGFVADGFELPEAKTHISWADPDTVLVGTDFGEDSLTESGYPRVVKRWRRGEPLSDAPTLFEGARSDVMVAAGVDRTPGFERTLVRRAIDFFNEQVYELRGDELIRIDAPTDATLSVHRQWLLIELRTDWFTGSASYAAGSLLAADYEEFLAGTAQLQVVFEPDEHTALHQYAWTRDRLVVVTLADVASRVEIAIPGNGDDPLHPASPRLRSSRGTWERRPVTDVPANTNTVIVAADDTGDEIFLDSSGFDTPSRLLHGAVDGPLQQIKSAPSFFDAEGLSVSQHFVASKDGTSIPYFVVRPQDATGPTLLGGYGGFEVARTPVYDGVLGRLWLARGGTYVLANIRGGGEYGPGWHTQAMREGRHLVAEDFAAVAADLVARGITTVEQLGAQGGSNGGLLMGIMLTQYPELFGALVCQVPLLDMRRFHLLLAGASWVAEYGNPDDPADWEFISEYSPYHHISSDRQYPPVLITTSTRDDRVHPGHARKMTAALEAAGHRVWYYENIEGGHAGAADNAQIAFKSALSFSFLWRMLTGDDRGNRD
ncbi:prolyl oligopeptidase family serine peptidase [Mycobacterium shimoidei]|uniref:Putative peptidase [Mycobacterium tuberculosis H37Rv] n=1 Tax=Mycobacterium shimoidei TaxID=29313 RepID=A0A1E3TC35_MYCSH|nr:prolyl oligopeptidase family serine peptidase [Mycobacterium shimoidei]MCV7257770.1 S9 family peptidase [Mycobacterium shimoidei]ODR11987.1 prolyl oligopeptidase [Mycobacterium shimoidei]ORW81487.1 prolyl oligopeptidase [Mycobacterium shimoidei]SRX92324.1 putative peptidase [Mycobacterium tuberculosis H37Rv] [Mycobacterium shimoidei]